MRVGTITIDGKEVGVVSLNDTTTFDTFVPNLDGYTPMGRAADAPIGGEMGGPGGHPSGAHHHHYVGHHAGEEPYTPHKNRHHYVGHHPSSPGHDHAPGRPVRQGSAEVDQAIVDAARAHHLDPNTMRAVASIESDMNPSSNANRATQYKGLYQIGRDEWRRFGEGNIYSAHDNAMAAARMFEANRNQFREHFHRDPTDAELYMMHQQGLGFYTRGAMTNISGNPYPGMHGAQTHDSFEAGWGHEVERRKEQFAHGGAATASAPRPTVSPGAVESPSGDPAAFIMHHTGGRGSVEGVENTLHQRGLGVQYIMDREGNITEAGGHSHMLPGWGKGEGLSNQNTVGMEVIAKDNNDVTPAQIAAAKAFIANRYPHTPVYGHGEVNPGHKEADEGMAIVNAIRADRAAGKSDAADKPFDPETMAP